MKTYAKRILSPAYAVRSVLCIPRSRSSFTLYILCNTKNAINNQICKSCELLRIITYASGELLFTNKTSFVNIAIIFASLT